jgi:predicted permease
MDSIRQDLVYALRRLTATPAFTAVAVLTLAIGIGANGALFSIVNGVLLRPLPYPEPDRLVRVVGRYEGRNVVLSPPNLLDVGQAAKSFDGLSPVDNGAFTMTGHGEPRRVTSAEVGAAFFRVMGVAPVQGRGFVDGENEPGREQVVVLSDRLWRAAFGADPGIVGQPVLLDGRPYAVVGVAAPGFEHPAGTELWVPMVFDERFRKARGAWYLGSVARLKPGVPLDQARAELQGIGENLEREYKEQNEGLGVSAIALRDDVVGDVGTALFVLLGAVGCVLLIGCVNVANLLLVRHSGRAAELAVRTALGASRTRLLRQLMIEALALGVMGGALGVMVAYWGREALLKLQPGELPRVAETQMDGAVVAFCAALSMLTALLFGALPALASLRRDPALALREGGRSLLGGRARLRGGLVVAEIALAVTLLVGASLLARSFTQLRRVDPGIQTPNALTFRTALPEAVYGEDAQRRAFYQGLEEKLAAIPGVTRVGSTMGLPLSDIRFNLSFEVEGRASLPPAQQPSLEVRVVTPGYFSAIGIPVLKGRGLVAEDGPESEKVVVLSKAAVQRYFPNEDPLGRRLRIGWGGPGTYTGGTVVGVVGDVRDHGLSEDHPPEVYLPYAQKPVQNMSVVLRTAADPAGVTGAARAALRELGPDLPFLRVKTLDEVLAASVATPRFYALLLGSFAATALGLAALGVFGVLSYAVAQRSREIGVRLALGALPSDVVRLVLREAIVLAALGLAIGGAASLLVGRGLSSLLFGLAPTDPASFGVAGLLLGTAALVAAALPALRAARVDPLLALRSE